MVARRIKTGAGAVAFGLGVSLVFGLPPPWWPDMPPFFVHMGLTAGACLAAWSGGLLFVQWCEDHIEKRFSRYVISIWQWLAEPRRPMISTLTGIILILAIPIGWSILSPEFGHNFYVSFSFPSPRDAIVGPLVVNYKFINNERNPISIEGISLLQITATNGDKAFHTLDGCNVPELADFAKFFEPSIPTNLIAFGEYTKAAAMVARPSSSLIAKVMWNSQS